MFDLACVRVQAGYSVSDLRDADCGVLAILKAGIDDAKRMREGGFDLAALKEVNP